MVKGVDPALASLLRERYERRCVERLRAKAAGQRMPRALKDPQVRVLRRTVIYGPTIVLESAVAAKAMAERGGWLAVRIEERGDTHA